MKSKHGHPWVMAVQPSAVKALTVPEDEAGETWWDEIERLAGAEGVEALVRRLGGVERRQRVRESDGQR